MVTKNSMSIVKVSDIPFCLMDKSLDKCLINLEMDFLLSAN